MSTPNSHLNKGTHLGRRDGPFASQIHQYAFYQSSCLGGLWTIKHTPRG